MTTVVNHASAPPQRPGAYKVDISRGRRIGRVSSEWFSRPDDERYLSLRELHAATSARARRATTRTVETREVRVEASLSDLVRSSLRLRPDRIPIGEVRGGEALELLKAWGTGHPGGIGTIHAGTAIGALRRLEQLIQEAIVTVPRAMVAETINLIAVLVRDGHGRRLSELARVEGLGADGDYRLSLFPTPSNGAMS